MNFLRLLYSVRPAINRIAVGALTIVISMELWLRKIPELITYGQELGEIIYRVCLSIISSYVFYFFVVHMKAEQDKTNTGVYVARRVRRILLRTETLMSELVKGSQFTTDGLLSNVEEVQRIFLVRRLTDAGPISVGFPPRQANWLDFLYLNQQDDVDSINKMFRKMNFLDTELVSILGSLEESEYYGFIEQMGKELIGNPLMNDPRRHSESTPEFAAIFSQYLGIYKLLKIYYEKELRKLLPD